jgi:hypothetical protein
MEKCKQQKYLHIMYSRHVKVYLTDIDALTAISFSMEQLQSNSM